MEILLLVMQMSDETEDILTQDRRLGLVRGLSLVSSSLLLTDHCSRKLDLHSVMRLSLGLHGQIHLGRFSAQTPDFSLCSFAE